MPLYYIKLPISGRPQINLIITFRNTDEFSIHQNFDRTNPKTVGYFIGSKSKNDLICVNPDSLETVKDQHKRVARLFQFYIRQNKRPAYLVDKKDTSKGFWRGIQVRSNLKNEVMVTVCVHPQDLNQGLLGVLWNRNNFEVYFV